MVGGVFVLMLMVSSSYGVGLSSQEFNSEESCEAARIVADEKFDSSFRSVYSFCVEK